MNIDELKKFELIDSDKNKLKNLLKVTRENSNVIDFFKAQCSIGSLFLNNNYTQEAIRHWSRVKLSDDEAIYAKATFNIGIAYKRKNMYRLALEYFEKIKYNYSAYYFSAACYHKASIFSTLENDFEEALRILKKINKEDGKKFFAAAQFQIAKIYENKKDDYDKALIYLYKIDKKSSTYFYDLAILNVANIKERYFQKDEELINIMNNLSEEADNDIRLRANYLLGKLYFKLGEYKKSEEYFLLSKEYAPYDSLCFINIGKMLNDDCTYNFGIEINKLFNFTKEIVSLLEIDFDSKVNGLKSRERKLAHYTNTDTCNKLIDDNFNKINASRFRLNTISNVNDPSEGQVLRRYLKSQNKENSYDLKIEGDLHTFIGCFTFNHDSLNQFRLYGKTDHKEASGLSLVFSKRFFQARESLSSDAILSSQINNKKEDFDTSNKDSKIDRFKAIRCIYLEPKSNFVQIAHRSCITFYDEFEDKDDPNEVWRKYKEEIDEKNNKVSKLLHLLKECYENININYKEYYKKNLDIIEEILLPLNYIIKHSAFQEEQECRIIYITSLKDPKVKMDFGKFLYVDYEPEVKANLDKIYIAPAATQYQPYLAKLLCDTDVKIELSNNPFRLPTSY